MNEIIAIDCRFLVCLEKFPEPLLFSTGDLLSGYSGNSLQFGLPDPLVRPLEAAEVEYPVKDCACLRAELPVNLLLLDDDRIAGFIESE